MAQVQHSALTDPNLHEPKGASTASVGTVYVSNGSGSGTWTTPPSANAPTAQIAMFPLASVAGWLICNGAAVSRTTYADLFNLLVTTAGFTGETFTVTVGSPAVFTKTGHNFVGGERIRLSTNGALPTGLSTTVDYYVIYVSANTFYVSTTFNGGVVNTTGTQSGTHTYTQSLYGLGDGSTTFNVPDFRGLFPRGADAGRGIDTGRTVGSEQMDMFQGHYHEMRNANYTIYFGGAGNATGGSSLSFDQVGIGGPVTGANGTVRFGNETRPRNFSINYFIKT